MNESCQEIVDPRIRRTRQLLQQALAKLLETKEFEKISVQDITEAATLNRATFYDHYGDKFALARMHGRGALSGIAGAAGCTVRWNVRKRAEGVGARGMRLSCWNARRGLRAAKADGATPGVGGHWRGAKHDIGRVEAAFAGAWRLAGDDCHHGELGGLWSGQRMGADTEPLPVRGNCGHGGQAGGTDSFVHSRGVRASLMNRSMHRRNFMRASGAGILAALPLPAAAADFTLHIQPVTVELSPKHHVKTTGYNGTAPGPLLRVPEGKIISIDVVNETDIEEVVHWHGLHIPSNVDGSIEEGTPAVAPHSSARYTFAATPAARAGITRMWRRDGI